MNDVSAQLYYGNRMIISALIEKPITWKVSKVENFHPLGLNKLTLQQDKFNEKTDYINFDTGDMYADYYKTFIEPEEYTESDVGYPVKIVTHGANKTIKVPGYSKKLSLESNGYDYGIAVWKIDCSDPTIIDMLYITYDGEKNEVLYLSTDDFDAVGSVVEIYALSESGHRITDTEKLEVVSF